MKRKIVQLLIIGVLIFNGFELVALSEGTVKDLSQLTCVDQYTMVVITPEKFSTAIQPLIDHKNDHGMLTKLVTLDEIYNVAYFPVQGRDDQEKIKYFIRDALDTWSIQYVLLIGNIEKIPMRKSAIQCSWFWFEHLLTDLYYADIYDGNGSFCCWDSNHNNKFGEFTWDMSHDRREYIDFVDLYPDVGVGRLPCSNKREVEAMANKIITYETQTYGEDWFNRLILIGGDTFPSYSGIEGEMVTEHIGKLMQGFEQVKLWTSTNTFKPLLINREISAGAGFVSYSGHGKEYEISTNLPQEEQRIHYFTPYLLGLFNGDKLPVIFFDACLTAKLDFSIFRMKFPCFAWAIVKKPSGGAIAAIGATELGYGGFVGDPLGGGTSRMNANFFEAYEPGITLSQMFTRAQTAYLNDVWKDCVTLEEFNLIGDPSLRIGGYP